MFVRIGIFVWSTPPLTDYSLSPLQRNTRTAGGEMVVTTNSMHDVSSESFAEEKFRLAVEACPSGMVMTDGAGVARDMCARPQILHVDDDHDMLEIVAQVLNSTADMVSVDSIEEARCALLLHYFDLAILDITLGPASGLDLLADLRSRRGSPIPVVIFSAHSAELESDLRIATKLNKSADASLRSLVTTVHDRLMLKSTLYPMEAI